MKKIFAASAIAILCAVPAYAESDFFYAGLNAGVGSFYANDRSLTGFSGAATFGADLTIVRAEIEYNYISGKRHTRNAEAQVGMVNLYLCITTPVVKPYVGLGMGSVFDGKVGTYDISSKTAYQGMLGLQFSIPDTQIDIDTEGRILFAVDVLPDTADGSNIMQTEFRVKMRYKF